MGSSYFPSAADVSESLDVYAVAKAFSNVNWATFAVSSAFWRNASATTDSNAQNNERVYLLPGVLRAGTWTWAVEHGTASTFGIITFSLSPDASSWTDITTLDEYTAGTVNSVRTELTGLTVAAGMKYLRLKMATKNASSSAYTGRFSGISGVRTGA